MDEIILFHLSRNDMSFQGIFGIICIPKRTICTNHLSQLVIKTEVMWWTYIKNGCGFLWGLLWSSHGISFQHPLRNFFVLLKVERMQFINLLIELKCIYVKFSAHNVKYEIQNESRSDLFNTHWQWHWALFSRGHIRILFLELEYLKLLPRLLKIVTKNSWKKFHNAQYWYWKQISQQLYWFVLLMFRSISITLFYHLHT